MAWNAGLNAACLSVPFSLPRAAVLEPARQPEAGKGDNASVAQRHVVFSFSLPQPGAA